MDQASTPNRRRHVRYPLATTVQFYHGPSRRQYPARSVDISHGGILMYVPATVPVSRGQPIRLTIGSTARPELAGLGNKPLDGTIVRVDRQRMLQLGHVPVGIRFATAQA